MKKVIILRGLPGSGKSTHVKNMLVGLDGYAYRVVSADQFFMVDGEYRFKPEKIGEAHACCFKDFLAALRHHTEWVVVDNTNTSAVEISPYILGAQAYGYEVEIHQVECDPEVAASRNIHGVPRETILKMAERMKEPLPPFWERQVFKQESSA